MIGEVIKEKLSQLEVLRKEIAETAKGQYTIENCPLNQVEIDTDGHKNWLHNPLSAYIFKAEGYEWTCGFCGMEELDY